MVGCNIEEVRERAPIGIMSGGSVGRGLACPETEVVESEGESEYERESLERGRFIGAVKRP